MVPRRALIVAALVGLSIPVVGQTPPRLVELPMDPPKGILESMPLGALPGNQVLHLSVALPYADPAGIQRFVDSVSDPKSPTYRQFITPEEVGRRFGLPAAAVQKVASYLTSQGMVVHLVAKNHISILAEATVAQAQAAFHTSIESFVTLTPASIDMSVKHFAYTATPALPAEISPYVTYIGGLENFTRPKPLGDFPVSPTQLQSFYNVAPMYSGGSQGLGRTIAISNFDGYSLNNVAPWYSEWNLPTPSVGMTKNISIENPPGDSSGQNASAQGEGDLDIQSVLGMAPLCNLIIYDAGSGNNDLLGVLTLEQNDNTADIVTESYGWSGPSSFYTAAHNIHLSMSAQGMTYMAASGDYGTASLDGDSQQPARPYPDEDPEVLIVGGTTTQTSKQGGVLTSQTGWSGSGGGWTETTDSFNTLPSYQTGTGVPTNINARLCPDVALNADPNTGFYIYLQSGEGGVGSTGFYVIGGTSGASPTFAGSLGDTEEQIIANGGLPANSKGKQRFGRIQDLLYSFNGSSAIFTDITSGSNGTLPNGNTSNAGVGWDTVTGWGVMNFDGLALAESDQVTAISVSPSSVQGGSGTTVTGTVTLQNAAPANGVTVTLASSNSAAASIPTTVSIASGANSGQFSVTTSSVASNTSVTLTATLNGNSQTTTLTVTPPTVSAASLSPSSVVGGNPSTGTITVTDPAPTGGLTISLASDNTSAATVPSTMTIAQGQTSGTFTVTTVGVASTSTAHITATFNGTTQSATLSVTAAGLTSVSSSLTSLYGDEEATGTLTLTGAAPPGGARIPLSVSNSSLAEVSTSALTIPAGSTTGTFVILAKPVDTATTVEIKATYGSVAKEVGVTVRPAIMLSVAATPSVPLGGVNSVTATFNLNSPAGPSGVNVKVSTTQSAATPAASTVFIASGKKSATLTVTTSGVSANTTVYIDGVFGVTKDAAITVLAATLNTLSLSSSSTSAGTTVTGTVTLNGPAGPGARSVTLTSSDPSAATVPATVSIPAGATSAQFTITPNPVTKSTSVTITARLGGTAKTQIFTVSP